MNAYEVKAGIGVIAGKTVDLCLSASSVTYPGTTKRALCKYTYFTFLLI